MKKLLLLIGLAIWMSDGRSQTFSSVDVNTGAGNSSPALITDYNGKVYFRANDATHGYELWVSDGTQANTHIVKDMRPGPGSSFPNQLVVVNNLLFFTASDSIHGNELWVTDGTDAGTVMLTDINPGTTSSSAYYLTGMNNKVYFGADDGNHGNELWVSDGTTGGTSLLKDINPGSSGSGPTGYATSSSGLIYNFTLFNNKIYFRANDGVHGVELWVTDGTTSGTTMISDIRPGPGSGAAYLITPFNNMLIFSGTDSIHGIELWVTDGTSAGTTMIKDIEPGVNGAYPGNYSGYVMMGGNLYFEAATDAEGLELWKTDGTTLGTTLVKDILAGPGSSQAGVYGLATYNGKLYFSASDSVNAQQLWTSDGTTAGTTLLKILTDVVPQDALPRGFIDYNGQMLFAANAGATNGGQQLWTSDGTAAGTHVIAPAIAPNSDPLNFTQLCPSGGQVYFEANYNSIGAELWTYRTTGVGIHEASGNTISLYPNPFSYAMNLSGLQSGEKYTMSVMNIAGQECYSATVDHVSENMTVTMPELSAGVYVVRLASAGENQMWKMVRE